MYDKNSEVIALSELGDLNFLKDGKVFLFFFQKAKTNVTGYLKDTRIMRSIHGWFIICCYVICDIIRAPLAPKFSKNSARVFRDYPHSLFVFALFPKFNIKIIPIDGKPNSLKKIKNLTSFQPNSCSGEKYNKGVCLFSQR